MRPWLLLLLLPACPPPEAADDDDATEPLVVPPPDAEHLFSFAVLADPHVTSEGDHANRLRSCVDWIADEEDARAIELVLVVGDIGWGGGLELSRDILDELPVPYVPILGDNPIQGGDEEDWDRVFGPHLDALADVLPNWTRGPVAGWTPVEGTEAWFQNAAFDLGGLRFVTLDWNTRHVGGLLGELADLHEFDGGTLPFLDQQLANLTEGWDENVVFASHHPMHVPSFTADEMATLTDRTAPHRHRVFADFAGHYHADGHEVNEEAGFEVFVTDATWDDVVTIRLVEVWGDGSAVTYVQDLVVLD
jgi:hypothetical protein